MSSLSRLPWSSLIRKVNFLSSTGTLTFLLRRERDKTLRSERSDVHAHTSNELDPHCARAVNRARGHFFYEARTLCQRDKNKKIFRQPCVSNPGPPKRNESNLTTYLLRYGSLFNNVGVDSVILFKLWYYSLYERQTTLNC